MECTVCLEGVCVAAVPGLCRARSGRCTMYRLLYTRADGQGASRPSLLVGMDAGL